jgi:hypothetical protein
LQLLINTKYTPQTPSSFDRFQFRYLAKCSVTLFSQDTQVAASSSPPPSTGHVAKTGATSLKEEVLSPPSTGLFNGQARLTEHAAMCTHKVQQAGASGAIAATAVSPSLRLNGWPFLAFPDPFTTKVTTTV